MEMEKVQAHVGCVSLVPIFNHLDEESMTKIAKKAHHKDLRRGNIYTRLQMKMIPFILYTKGKFVFSICLNPEKNN
jgi:hypothetical protein